MRSALLAGFLFAIPVTAFAQDSMPVPTNCQELVGQLGELVAVTPEGQVEDIAGGCRLTNVYFKPGTVGRMKIGELSIVAPDLFEACAKQRPPEQVELSLAGVFPSPDSGSPMTTYIVEMQAEPVQLHLNYRWDRTAQTLELADFSVTSADKSSFRFGARVSNVNLYAAGFDDLAKKSVTLDQFTVQIDNARFLSSYLLPVLVGMLPSDQDPRPLIAGYITTATRFIEGLPDASVPDDAKAALVSFLQSFPRIRGDYSLELRADPGISLSEVAATPPENFAHLLARVQVAATHTPPQQP